MTIANLEHGNPASASAGAAARAASGPAAALSIVSIVIPVFNEGENLRELVARIDAAITPTGRPFELILVDDGSTDDSRAVLAQLARDHNWLRPLLLIRNYGQSTALQAGFDHVRGELVVTLDGDLQNEPAEIPRLLELLDADRSIDVVSGWRKQRQDRTWSRKVPSWIANRLISAVTGVRLHDSIKDGRMKLTVVGTGYVGLVTGVCFADVGNDVLCIDIDELKVQRLLRGEMPMHEPGLDEVAIRNLHAGRLHFSSDYGRAVAHSDVFFIAVGTPTDEDGSADVRHVERAARELGRRISREALLVVKSTVPVGTSERVRRAVNEELAARGVKVAISVASNPEFLKEGAAMQDFMHPDRILIGTEDRHAIDVLTELYAPFNRNRERLQVLDARSSELAKYAANAMLATRISFMNELARLSERLGADIERVRHAIAQ